MEFIVLSIKEFSEEPFVYGLRSNINFKLEVELNREEFQSVLSNFNSIDLENEVVYFIDYTLNNIFFYGEERSIINIRRQVEDILLFS